MSAPDDLTLPFIFVPHGMAGSPEVAEWRAAHPGWFSIPATFHPRAPDRPAEMRTPEAARTRRRPGPPPPRPGSGRT